MGFEKATKQQAKLRLAIVGPSGAGKTYTALRIANGIGGPIGFIDTERKTARKYADRFDFDVCELDDRTIEGYVKEIRGAGSQFNVLIIDSLSHAWQELLEQVDKLAKAKYRGNTWSAWSEGTPKQKSLIDTILTCPAHLIATMRSKTSWSEEKDERTGKIKPVKVGLAPEQGKNIEFEFDMLMEMTTDHIATVTKDRTGKFQDAIIEKPGEELGKSLLAWLSEGAKVIEPPAAAIPERATAAQVAELDQLILDAKVTQETIAAWHKKAGVETFSAMPATTIVALIEHLKKRKVATVAA